MTAFKLPAPQRVIDEIVVHTTATRTNWMKGHSVFAKRDEIRRWHVEDRKWRDIGYHFVIDRDGQVAPGRPIGQRGAHVKGRNARTIGIALIGGFGGAAHDGFDMHYTAAQDKALRDLIAQLEDHLGALHLSGHNEYAAKACPCFVVRDWYRGTSEAAAA